MKTVSFNNFSAAVRSFWENLTWDNITATFGIKTKQRGSEYAQSGNVTQLWMSEDGSYLLAAVQGSEKYYTHIQLKQDKKNKFSIHSECTCPVGCDCKHAVAAVAVFLDRFAKNQPVPFCKQIDDTIWKVCNKEGKSKNIMVDFYEEDEGYDDEEYAEDNYEDDDCPPKKNVKNKAKAAVGNDIKQSLKKKTADELISVILFLAEEYDNVREYFELEQLSAAAGKNAVQDKLLHQVLAMMDKEEKSHRSYGSYYNEYGNPFDFGKVAEVIKQFKKFDNPLPAFDAIADKLFKIGIKALGCSEIEDSDEFDAVIEAMVEVLKQSKTDAADKILWAYQMSHKSDYGIGEYALSSLKEHPWSAKNWADAADRILNGNDTSLSCIRLDEKVKILDKAKRQNEATDLLRREAKQPYEQGLLVKRLMGFNLLDEAEHRLLELYRKPNSHLGQWNEELKTLAEKRKDSLTLASIQAAEFFEQPCRNNLNALLKTIDKLKDKELLRKEIAAFLETGILPSKKWTIPPFEFARTPKSTHKHYALLCRWAIDEKRTDDVLRWFDIFVKSRTSGDLNKIEVADAVIDKYPERALAIYREQAEYEFEQTRHYEDGIKILRKAKTALKSPDDWSRIIAELRCIHKRKSNLMKLLDELEAGSIVKQKQRGR